MAMDDGLNLRAFRVGNDRSRLALLTASKLCQRQHKFNTYQGVADPPKSTCVADERYNSSKTSPNPY